MWLTVAKKSEKTSFRKLKVCPKEIERTINSVMLDVRTQTKRKDTESVSGP